MNPCSRTRGNASFSRRWACMLRGNAKDVEEVVVRAVYMCTEKEGRTLDLGLTQGLKTLAGRYTPTMSSLISAASWYVSELLGKYTILLI